MSQGHVEAKLLLVCADDFKLVHHEFCSNFVPAATCCTEINSLNFVGHCAVTKCCRDAMSHVYILPSRRTTSQSINVQRRNLVL